MPYFVLYIQKRNGSIIPHIVWSESQEAAQETARLIRSGAQVKDLLYCCAHSLDRAVELKVIS